MTVAGGGSEGLPYSIDDGGELGGVAWVCQNVSFVFCEQTDEQTLKQCVLPDFTSFRSH